MPGSGAALAKIPLTTLGVGDKVAKKLAKLGLVTVQDAIFHLPLRYEDRTRIANIAMVRPGQSEFDRRGAERGYKVWPQTDVAGAHQR